jgi:hypothetical protein
MDKLQLQPPPLNYNSKQRHLFVRIHCHRRAAAVVIHNMCRHHCHRWRRIINSNNQLRVCMRVSFHVHKYVYFSCKRTHRSATTQQIIIYWLTFISYWRRLLSHHPSMQQNNFYIDRINDYRIPQQTAVYCLQIKYGTHSLRNCCCRQTHVIL